MTINLLIHNSYSKEYPFSKGTLVYLYNEDTDSYTTINPNSFEVGEEHPYSEEMKNPNSWVWKHIRECKDPLKELDTETYNNYVKYSKYLKNIHDNKILFKNPKDQRYYVLLSNFYSQLEGKEYHTQTLDVRSFKPLTKADLPQHALTVMESIVNPQYPHTKLFLVQTTYHTAFYIDLEAKVEVNLDTDDAVLSVQYDRSNFQEKVLMNDNFWTVNLTTDGLTPTQLYRYNRYMKTHFLFKSKWNNDVWYCTPTHVYQLNNSSGKLWSTPIGNSENYEFYIDACGHTPVNLKDLTADQRKLFDEAMASEVLAPAVAPAKAAPVPAPVFTSKFLTIEEEQRQEKHALTKKHDLRFWNNGYMTVAWKRPQGKILEISTSLCNPIDKFDKRTGQYYAARAFDEGKTVKIPLLKCHSKVEETLDYYFVDAGKY